MDKPRKYYYQFSMLYSPPMPAEEQLAPHADINPPRNLDLSLSVQYDPNVLDTDYIDNGFEPSVEYDPYEFLYASIPIENRPQNQWDAHYVPTSFEDRPHNPCDDLNGPTLIYSDDSIEGNPNVFDTLNVLESIQDDPNVFGTQHEAMLSVQYDQKVETEYIDYGFEPSLEFDPSQFNPNAPRIDYPLKNEWDTLNYSDDSIEGNPNVFDTLNVLESIKDDPNVFGTQHKAMLSVQYDQKVETEYIDYYGFEPSLEFDPSQFNPNAPRIDYPLKNEWDTLNYSDDSIEDSPSECNSLNYSDETNEDGPNVFDTLNVLESIQSRPKTVDTQESVQFEAIRRVEYNRYVLVRVYADDDIEEYVNDDDGNEPNTSPSGFMKSRFDYEEYYVETCFPVEDDFPPDWEVDDTLCEQSSPRNSPKGTVEEIPLTEDELTMQKTVPLFLGTLGICKLDRLILGAESESGDNDVFVEYGDFTHDLGLITDRNTIVNTSLLRRESITKHLNSASGYKHSKERPRKCKLEEPVVRPNLPWHISANTIALRDPTPFLVEGYGQNVESKKELHLGTNKTKEVNVADVADSSRTKDTNRASRFSWFKFKKKSGVLDGNVSISTTAAAITHTKTTSIGATNGSQTGDAPVEATTSTTTVTPKVSFLFKFCKSPNSRTSTRPNWLKFRRVTNNTTLGETGITTTTKATCAETTSKKSKRSWFKLQRNSGTTSIGALKTSNGASIPTITDKKAFKGTKTGFRASMKEGLGKLVIFKKSSKKVYHDTSTRLAANKVRQLDFDNASPFNCSTGITTNIGTRPTALSNSLTTEVETGRTNRTSITTHIRKGSTLASKEVTTPIRTWTLTSKDFITPIRKGRTTRKSRGKPTEIETGRTNRTSRGKPTEIETGRTNRTSRGKPTEIETGRTNRTSRGKPTEIETGRTNRTSRGKPTEIETGRTNRASRGIITNIETGHTNGTSRGISTDVGAGSTTRTSEGITTSIERGDTARKKSTGSFWRFRWILFWL